MVKKEMEYKYLEEVLKNNLFAVVFPKDKTEDSARKIAEIVDSAAGVAQFKEEEEKMVWGVLIDKTKEAKKHIKLESTEEIEK